MERPKNSTSPASGEYIPVKTLKSVVLPAPFGPIIPKISFSLTSNVRFDRACRPPKRLVRSLPFRIIIPPLKGMFMKYTDLNLNLTVNRASHDKRSKTVFNRQKRINFDAVP